MLVLSKIRKNFYMGPAVAEVLKGVSLRVREGDMVSISGPSGCGKSTLMNILGLLDRPSSGTYKINGRAVAYVDDDVLSRIRNKYIGFVFQQYHLLAKLSALENVMLPLIYRGVSYTSMRDMAMEKLRQVGMDDKSHHRPSELSGGQQQRVAIARALACQPKLILADEPTGALDSSVGQEIMDLFLELNAEQGITVVIITHDPQIARQCSRMTQMRDGMLTE